ncbi:hypothetical protein AWH48_01190 [Domibacillus aminovorans]|uniref:Lipoprotein n=1 Tax=Domibacillus aminovorans TaxID=29332 RepID=A0A177KWE0_9BACI|nr:hypothetical protein [Domibacillus aminovorans]OAH57663.1 hypothetical protein AWH48_01190 [Domibacillus aminovorans]
MKKYPPIVSSFAVLLLFLTGCQSDDSQDKKDSDIDSHPTEEAPVQERPSSKNDITLEGKGPGGRHSTKYKQ